MRRLPYPAGQVAPRPAAPPATPPAASSTAITAPTTQSAQIRVGDNGRISGIDGMLDQMAEALTRAARTELLPTLQQDRSLQIAVGRAIGRELAKPLWLLAGAAVVYAGWRLCRGKP